MMRYLEGETISDEEIMDCLIKGIRQAIIFPVLCGSAYKDIGLGRYERDYRFYLSGYSE